MKKKIEIVFHYPVHDSKFQGDYHGVDVIIEGKHSKSYGNAYIDRGGIQAESYVQGFINATDPDLFEIERKNVADREVSVLRPGLFDDLPPDSYF